MSKYLYYLRYFILGISLTLFILLSQRGVGNAEVPTSNIVLQAASPQAKQQNLARILTQKGHQLLNQGQSEEALHTWQEATKLYRELHNQEGEIGSLINQSLALQANGLYPLACITLIQALDLQDWICQSSIQMQQVPDNPQKLLVKAIQAEQTSLVRVTGLRNLGDVLLLIGKIDESYVVLQQALAMIKRLNPGLDTNDILLSLGNTEKALYSRARSRFQATENPVSKAKQIKIAQVKLKAALGHYQQISDFPSSKKNQSDIALQARLNRLSLSLDLERSESSSAEWDVPELKTLQSEAQLEIQPLLEQLLTARYSELPPVQSIYARLNFASSLMKVGQNIQLQQLLQGERNTLNVALKISQEALQVARHLKNMRAKSYASGTIGNLYSQLGQPSQSQHYLEEALAIAQSIQAWDVAYQWQRQLGQLYQRQRNLNKAIEAYQAAVNNLEQVRGNILSINPDVQFFFKENVEPIYREYMRLLLAAPNPNLKQVIRTNEQLQLAELQNFLQCGKLDLVSLDKIYQDNRLPAVIHIINLGERVEVIVQSPDQALHRHTPNSELVKRNADNLLTNFQDTRFADTDEQVILSYSQTLYKQLIAPIEAYLPKSGNLVFVLDSYFQNLPMVLLHNGENYLLKQYSISVTLGSQLRQPKALQRGQLKALIAGLSKKSPSLKAPEAPKNLAPLPEVKAEIVDIKKNTLSSVELLDEKFTSERFQYEIDRSGFPVVHITTHGQFSSDPEQTVILAWNKAINVRQLNYLLRGKNQNAQDSIELMVLSACETAKGDKRSALGIAGVAAQAGARSTVASLWLVDAKSTASLMGEFYKGLKVGLSKAEALRQAQITLLEKPEYQHPYYWAPFVLVGSWL